MSPVRVVLALAVLAAVLAPLAHAAKVQRTPRGPVVTYTEEYPIPPAEVAEEERVEKATLSIAVRRVNPRRIAYDLRFTATVRKLPPPEEKEAREEETPEEKAEREGPVELVAYAQACNYRLNRARDGIGRILLGLGEGDDVLRVRRAEGRVRARLRGETELRVFQRAPSPYRPLRIFSRRADAACFGLDEEPTTALLPVKPADPDPRDVKRAELEPAAAGAEGGE